MEDLLIEIINIRYDGDFNGPKTLTVTLDEDGDYGDLEEILARYVSNKTGHRCLGLNYKSYTLMDYSESITDIVKTFNLETEVDIDFIEQSFADERSIQEAVQDWVAKDD